MERFSFYLITDIHYYAQSLGITGSAYEARSHSDQKCLAETGPILDAVIDKLLADKEIDTILIAGDVTHNGQKASHLEFEQKLRRLTAAGKKVRLITASHDVKKEPDGYDGDRRIVVEGLKREEFPALYAPYGFSDAIAYEPESQSYVSQLAPGIRLLALNDDGNLRSFSGATTETVRWYMEQIKKAHEAGEYIFVMSHHPVLPPSPVYPLFSEKDMIFNHNEAARRFADAGIDLIFTGHTHMQHINQITTEKGNVFYEVNTGSLVGYPNPIRKVTLTPGKAEITTEHIDSFDWDLGGKTVDEYLKDHFEYMIRDVLNSVGHDIDHFKELALGFSMSASTVDKLWPLLKVVGHILDTFTLGRLGKLAHIPVDPSVKDMLVKELVLELICCLYAGDPPYSPETPVYQVVVPAADKLAAKLKKLAPGVKLIEQLPEVLRTLMYNDGIPDNNATLKIGYGV